LANNPDELIYQQADKTSEMISWFITYLRKQRSPVLNKINKRNQRNQIDQTN